MLTFLFYHYGKIPKYLEYAIEHVRIFNPSSEIYLITEGEEDTPRLDSLGIKKFLISDFQSQKLRDFKLCYHHLSGYRENYERFCFERWFVTEIIREKNSEKTFIMVDSDVAVFGDIKQMLNYLPDCEISIAGNCPHFTFIRGSLDVFLDFILHNYKDSVCLQKLKSLYKGENQKASAINLSDMTLLHLHMESSDQIKNYQKDTPIGFVDTNIHIPEGFDYLELRRRPRKKIFWRLENGRTIPYFKRGDQFVQALILHFQGPGKRVFKRFNSLEEPPSPLQIWWWKQIFQRRWLANLM
jgi:hypothetical protein